MTKQPLHSFSSLFGKEPDHCRKPVIPHKHYGILEKFSNLFSLTSYNNIAGFKKIDRKCLLLKTLKNTLRINKVGLIMKDTYPSLGQYLRGLRKEKGQSLHQVSKGTAITFTLLSEIERTKRMPTVEQIIILAKHFKVAESELSASKMQNPH